MDLVDKKHRPRLQACEQRREVPLAVEGRAARRFKIGLHRVGENVRERGFAEARRSAQKHVVHRFAARLRGLRVNFKSLFDFMLARKIVERLRPQARFEFDVLGASIALKDAFLIHHPLLLRRQRRKTLAQSAFEVGLDGHLVDHFFDVEQAKT